MAMAIGCSGQVATESQRTDPLSVFNEPASSATSQDVLHLADRLKMITREVANSPERRVYGVNIPANYKADENDRIRVRKVVMSVNVFLCDDGCVDGPAQSPVGDDDLLLLQPFHNTLEQLDLQQTEVTDAGLKTVAELTRLRSLNLAGTAINGSGLAHLTGLTKLEHLDLSGTAVVPSLLQAVGELTTLRTVRIPKETITDEVLAILGHLPQLERLDFSESPVTDRGLSSLADLKSLEILDLSETNITDIGLAHLGNLTRLKDLRMIGTQITGAGLVHLASLTNLRRLDLARTQASDSGLKHLAGMKHLEYLGLEGTRVQGFGLPALKQCNKLRDISLPPIPSNAVVAVNSIKTWQSLQLRLIAAEAAASIGSDAVVTLNDMPDLSRLSIELDGPFERVIINNCTQLSSLHIAKITEGASRTNLYLGNTPNLQGLQLEGDFEQIEDRSALFRVAYIKLRGAVTPAVIRAIGRCKSLRTLNAEITDAIGEPLSIDEISELPKVEGAHIQLDTAAASWVLRLVGRMTSLKRLDLRGRNLTARDLAPLSDCTRLGAIYIRGINDPGEPLAFIESMPDLDQCLVLGCPRVGKVRLTEATGVRRFYFKYGRLDELEIDGPPNLTDVYLGNRAFGYNDADAELPRLDIQRVTARNAPELLYLMIDAQETNVPFAEIVLAHCSKLRSLTLHARPPDTQTPRCRLTASGTFSRLAACRLYNLVTDAASLARLGESEILKTQASENVAVKN